MSSNSFSQKRFSDERFQNKEGQLKQFIQISSSQLFLTRFDEQHQEYVYLEDFLLTDQANWLNAQRSLNTLLAEKLFQQAKSTSVCVADQLYTLVPDSLFDESKLESYLSFNHDLKENQQLKFYYNKIESLNTVVIYAIPRALTFLLQAKLPHFSLFHVCVPLLEEASLKKSQAKEIAVHIQKNRLDVVYIPEGKLTFCNSFEYQTAEDFIYYLLYVLEQLQLNQEEVILKLSGEFEEKSSIYELLYKYIKQVSIVERPLGVNYSPVLSELPQQYYHSPFSQHLCE